MTSCTRKRPKQQYIKDGLNNIYIYKIHAYPFPDVDPPKSPRPDSLSELPQKQRQVGLLVHQKSSSLFGSVDSEQSVPRTAPLATPEHDTSLLDVVSVDNLEMDNNNGRRTRLEGHEEEEMPEDVFTEHMDQVILDIFKQKVHRYEFCVF